MLTTTTQAFGAAAAAKSPTRTSLPRGLREEAGPMSPDAFHETYAPATGPLRLGNWECTDVRRRDSRIGPQARTYRATLAVGDRIGTCTASAGGPIGALTEMLHERGIAVEVREFHQRSSDGATTTYVRGTDGYRERWAMGTAQDGTGSALRAIVACANRLYAD